MFSDRPLFPLDLSDLEGVAGPSTPPWGTMAPYVRRGWSPFVHIIAPISSSIGGGKTQPRCHPSARNPRWEDVAGTSHLSTLRAESLVTLSIRKRRRFVATAWRAHAHRTCGELPLCVSGSARSCRKNE